MRVLRFARIFVVFVGATLLAGCGGGSMMPPGSSHPVGTFSWPNNANGSMVLDATGNQFYFGATSGIMYQANTNIQLSNFTISPKAAQTGVYPVTGNEGFCSPGICPALGLPFDVMLTNNPAGSGCMAVLASNIFSFSENFPPTFLTPDFFMGMTISTAPYGFSTSTTTVTAYKTYWAGNLPICGGSSPYVGTYTSTDTSSASFASGWTTSNGTCVAQSSSTSRNTGPPYVAFTIDSGGVVDSETSKIVGSIVTPITNSVLASPYVGSLHDATCAPVVSITNATQNASNKWVFTGTETFAGVSTPFTATQQ